jgi:hypothetical protein
MRISWLDGVATVLVVAAVAVFGFWLAGAEPFGFTGVRAVAAVVLALGVGACTAAVRHFASVYGGGGATRSALPYVAAVTIAGVATTVAAVTALITGVAGALWVLVTGVVVMWLLATTRHVLSGATRQPAGTSR